MSRLSKFHGPGYFYVLTQPKSVEFVDEYHEWYNSEHGPLRLKLDFISNGYRYKSLEVDPPVYLATYDLKKISGLDEPRYTVLRQRRSERESQILENKLNFLDRRIYSDISSRGRNGGPAPVIMTVVFTVANEHVDELNRWYEQEHTEDLSKIPGWRRTRRFELVEGDGGKEGYTELLAVHDFDQLNGLDGPEHQFAKTRPGRQKIIEMVESRKNLRFEFFHQFEASDHHHSANVTDHNTHATGATSWQLDGPHDGPVIAFSNSLLTDFRIWDEVLDELRTHYPRFRFLRYNTRGYECSSMDKIDMDLLTDDLVLLLDKLGIARLLAVIGVSMGGITALSFAIRYPQRVERFVACDCNAVSTAANTKAWQDRIALANREDGWRKLADQTVKRWFTSSAVQSKAACVSKVEQMILSASKAGFENAVGALCDFDLRQKLTQIEVPGYCVVGEHDGMLPGTMASFCKTIPGATFEQIAKAGHLPMVEQPKAFVQAIKPLLELQMVKPGDHT